MDKINIGYYYIRNDLFFLVGLWLDRNNLMKPIIKCCTYCGKEIRLYKECSQDVYHGDCFFKAGRKIGD